MGAIPDQLAPGDLVKCGDDGRVYAFVCVADPLIWHGEQVVILEKYGTGKTGHVWVAADWFTEHYEPGW